MYISLLAGRGAGITVVCMGMRTIEYPTTAKGRYFGFSGEGYCYSMLNEDAKVEQANKPNNVKNHIFHIFCFEGVLR